MIISAENLTVIKVNDLYDDWFKWLSGNLGIHSDEEIYVSKRAPEEIQIIGLWEEMEERFLSEITIDDNQCPSILSYYSGPNWRLWKTLLVRSEFPLLDFRVYAILDNDTEAVQFKLATS